MQPEFSEGEKVAPIVTLYFFTPSVSCFPNPRWRSPYQMQNTALQAVLVVLSFAFNFVEHSRTTSKSQYVKTVFIQASHNSVTDELTKKTVSKRTLNFKANIRRIFSMNVCVKIYNSNMIGS